MRILVVDDSKKQRKAAVEQLQSVGVEVVTESEYVTAVKRIERGEKFDVALLDLLMPAEAEMLAGKALEHLGETIDVGYPLAIKLALLGIKRIAVATDTTHHEHPSSAMMDWFKGKVIRIEESTVILMHAPTSPQRIKDWKRVLEMLMKADAA